MMQYKAERWKGNKITAKIRCTAYICTCTGMGEIRHEYLKIKFTKLAFLAWLASPVT